MGESERFLTEFGGERGIRTLDTLLTYTRFPGVLLQPLGHLSVFDARATVLKQALISNHCLRFYSRCTFSQVRPLLPNKAKVFGNAFLGAPVGINIDAAPSVEPGVNSKHARTTQRRDIHKNFLHTLLMEALVVAV